MRGMYPIQVDGILRPICRGLPPTRPRANDPFLSGDQGRRGAGVILEVGLNDLLGLVIPRQPVNPTLDENQAEFGVLVFSVDFEVFAYRDGLFDEVVQVFRDGGCEA